MSAPGLYSELEYLILAMVSEGVGSGYAMRRAMNKMRGGRWSSESGSVYRVLRRLEKDGLVIEARKAGAPNRERTEYDLTGQGRALLHSWLTFPPERSEFSYLVDPIRTRAYFLSNLARPDQLRVVKSWLQQSKTYLQTLQEEIERENFQDPIHSITIQNLVYLAEARHEWLRKLLASIKALHAQGDEQAGGGPTKAVVSEREIGTANAT